jgi:hypothetical protein
VQEEQSVTGSLHPDVAAFAQVETAWGCEVSDRDFIL